jgi:hypothetical protein
MPRVKHTGQEYQSACAPYEKISRPKQMVQSPTQGSAKRGKTHNLAPQVLVELDVYLIFSGHVFYS